MHSAHSFKMRGERGRVFRNMYKGHMDETKEGSDQGWEVRMAGVGEVVGRDGDNCT